MISMDNKKAAQDRRQETINSIGESEEWICLTREQFTKLYPGYSVKTMLIDSNRNIALLLISGFLSIISLCISLYAYFGK
jgi:hypothetical protein